eukprot:scaffold4043_cov224-Pinguiococcus_pyrenoidosus.AAC.1
MVNETRPRQYLLTFQEGTQGFDAIEVSLKENFARNMSCFWREAQNGTETKNESRGEPPGLEMKP